jgi:ketosteroid isomerase-like protein
MTTDHQQAIRAARSAMNDAIARRDLEGIGVFLLPSYHVVTARSLQRHGKDDSCRSWGEMFTRDQTSTHDRTPDEIYVNAEWGMAQEHGRWIGRLLAKDGPLEMSGVYAAKWHFTEQGWLLEAEIFTPLSVVRPGESLP